MPQDAHKGRLKVDVYGASGASERRPGSLANWRATVVRLPAVARSRPDVKLL